MSADGGCKLTADRTISEITASLLSEFGDTLKSVITDRVRVEAATTKNAALNMLAITGLGWSQIRHFHLHGMEVDIAIIPVIGFSAEYKRSGLLGRFLASGEIEYDRTDFFARLRTQVDPEDQRLRRRENLSIQDVAYLRLRPHIMGAAIRALVSEKAAAIVPVVYAATFELLATLFTLSGRDIPGVSERVAEVRRLFPALKPALEWLSEESASSVDSILRSFEVLTSAIGSVEGDELLEYSYEPRYFC